MNDNIEITSRKGTQKISVKPTDHGISILVRDVKHGTSNNIHVFDECIDRLIMALMKQRKKQSGQKIESEAQ